jgi:hypothetical protein
MIYLWEKNKVKPSQAQIPKIIEFLGRDPLEKETKNLGAPSLSYKSSPASIKAEWVSQCSGRIKPIKE